MKFKPEDFYTSENIQKTTAGLAARVANRKLEEWLSQAPVVYGGPTLANIYSIQQSKINTFKAKLVCIEELPKEPCKHEPVKRISPFMYRNETSGPCTYEPNCRKCGIELVAEWKAKP